MQHVPRKRYGQHFLVDRSYIRRIVDAIAPQPQDHIVEIGPGLGALTQPLLDHVDHLHVIEIDRDIVARLRTEHTPERLTIHSGDVLDFDFAALPAPLRVVGNLPYNISTELLFRLIPYASRIADACFMLQKEVVDRMVAQPSTAEYGRLSVMLQHRFAMTKLLDVPPGAFRPPPKVDSAVVSLTPLSLSAAVVCDEHVLAQVVTAAFTKRRKTLRNALAGVIDTERLTALGIDAGLRPENLAVADYEAIARAVAAYGAGRALDHEPGAN